jgi:DNA-binding Lrp family transcriptional regulator
MYVSLQNAEGMQKFLTLIRLEPTKTGNFFSSLIQLTDNPSAGVRLNATYNLFGEWDYAVWFEATDNDKAVHFVGEKLRTIEGVIETHTMPATIIKEYYK